MPDRWTQATEDALTEMLAVEFVVDTVGRGDPNRAAARAVLDWAAHHGLLVEPVASTEPWKPGDRCATCLSEDTYLNDDGHAACRGCGRSDDDDD
jgi:hypothetical protein